MAAALAGAFALPAALASAADDMANRQSSDKHARSATGMTGASRFDELDKNHDGYISRDEGRDAEELNTRFSELDTNNDNKLSRDEYNVLNQNARGASGATGSTRK
ncbi:MAG TPA: EF-hand domain-containing protein [Burkholderiales bacterium]|nr:EF-hand domain-containing protein [Burkholderiales bacterium]